MITYQKYFYPMQMQAIVGENMMNLSAAMKDQAFVQYQQKTYDDMLASLKKQEDRAKGEPDHEMQAHLDLLDKADLKTTGWTTTPLNNVEHDFVSPLLTAYLKDLNKRIIKESDKDSGVARNLRKAIRIEDTEDLLNTQFMKISSLKDQADEKEH